MSDFSNQYILYLIKQYYEKPKANAEMQFLISTWETYADFIKEFGNNFDIDNARGSVLDLIGRIVNLPRQVNDVVPIVFFGFSNNPSSKGFADKFDVTRDSAPFKDKFGTAYTPYQLQEPEYIKFLKIKIAKNNCSPYLVSDEKTSLQQVVFDAFEGRAYVVDNKDQSLSLYVSPSVSLDELRLILNLDILPRPITFNYRIIIQSEPGVTFGFSNNPNSKGFADKFDPSREGGIFARKLIL